MNPSLQSADAPSALANSGDLLIITSAVTADSSAAIRASSCFTYDCGLPLNFMGVRMGVSVCLDTNHRMALAAGGSHGR